MKVCTQCLQAKSLDDFSHRNNKPISTCKMCRCAYEKARRPLIKPKLDAQQKEYREKNKDKIKARQQKYRESRKSEAINRELLRKFGVSIEDRAEQFELQGKICTICKRSPRDGEAHFPIDHCHTTGELRSILCPDCNKGLGFFYDNPSVLRAAAQYVEKGSHWYQGTRRKVK